MDLSEKYPHIQFKKIWDINVESQFMLGYCSALIKAISLTPILPEHYSQLMKVSLIKGAQATTAIEGNTLSEEEIERIIDGAKLSQSKEYQAIEVKNVIDALNYLKTQIVDKNSVKILTPELIKNFHLLIAKNLGEHINAIPGKFRNDNRTVGKYRCPDYNDIDKLIANLCHWLKEEFHFPKDQFLQNVIIQAIITHVYIEWVHPFGDGNGRTGRLAEFYILLRGGNPNIASHILSNHYNSTRSEYYRQMDMARHKRDLNGFIEYALRGFLDGLLNTLEIIQKSQFEITWQKLIYDKLSDRKEGAGKETFRRRRLLILEIPLNKEFSTEDLLLLTPKLAREYAHKSTRTILRDIKELLNLNLLIKTGTKYKANIGILKGYLPESIVEINL